MKKAVISIVALVATTLPSLHLFGVKDVSKIGGVVNVQPVSRPSLKTFLNRRFQISAEEYYAKKFFLRGPLFRTRCQAYDWLNFGVFHEVRNRAIGQFADGTLFSQKYLKVYCDPEARVSKSNVDKSLSAMASLNKSLSSRSIDMVFILAADKIQMTDKPLPWLTDMLFCKRRTEFHSEYARLLSEYGIDSFDTFAFLTNKAPLYAESMYPYAGTHWNALGSTLVSEGLLTKLNEKNAGRYRINHFVGVEKTPTAQFADDDIGKMLNLFYNPYLSKNIRYVPVFEQANFTPNDGSIILFGDSFSTEILRSFEKSGEFNKRKILFCDKRVPSKKEVEKVMPDLRLVAFVYVTPNMLNLDVDKRFGLKIEAFCKLVQNLLSKRAVPGSR